MELKIKPQSIILLVGPTNSGKTFFVENILIPQLRDFQNEINKELNIQHLSDEKCCMELLGLNRIISKNDKRLKHVADHAINLIKLKIVALTTYPANSDFIIVDSNGISKEFRNEILEIAKTVHYNVHVLIFEGSHDLISKKEFPNQTIIKSQDFNDVNVEIDDFITYRNYFLYNEYNYLVIGDVHGCYDELIELLEKNGYVFHDDGRLLVIPDHTRIIFVGDLIDKGDQIPEVIRLVYRLVISKLAYLVRGNHENFVYNYMKGVKPYTELADEFIQNFIKSVLIFKEDTALSDMFDSLCEDAKDFLITENFIVTHAPCKREYLGKIKSNALKSQRNLRFARRREFGSDDEFIENTEREMEFMDIESNINHPYHIVGHVMLHNVIQFKNKLMIDTGCVAGGNLTSVLIRSNDGSININSVKSRKEHNGEIFSIFQNKK